MRINNKNNKTCIENLNIIKDANKMTIEEEMTNSTKCLRVDGKGLNNTNVECPKEIVLTTGKIKQMGDDCEDFYARLRNMYNKPQKYVTESNRNTVSDPFGDIEKARNTLTSDAKRFLKNMQRDRIEENKISKSSNEKIRYRWNENDDIECTSAHYDKVSPVMKPEFTKKGMNEKSSDPEPFDEKFPTMEDLPKDHEELEKLFFRYVDRLGKLADSMQRRCPNPEPGTEESVLSYEYKLDPSKANKDPMEAVLGERKCTCPETVEINGDTAKLKDLKLSVKELKNNHKVGAVVVSVSKKGQIVDESVDSSTKLKEMKGPVLMTKYALEFLSSKISKHPSLTSITFKNVPLSSAIQTLLIPSFANLKTLKLISVKLRDDGVKKICQYLWRSQTLCVIDFTDNGITKSGAEKVAKLIEKKGMCRSMDPEYGALERVTLNKNPLGTEGMKFILKVLQIDFFIKAVDMRDCEITSNADEILDFMSKNLDIQILDLRGNNIQRLDLVIKNVLQNRTEQNIYKWEDEEEILKYI